MVFFCDYLSKALPKVLYVWCFKSQLLALSFHISYWSDIWCGQWVLTLQTHALKTVNERFIWKQILTDTTFWFTYWCRMDSLIGRALPLPSLHWTEGSMISNFFYHRRKSWPSEYKLVMLIWNIHKWLLPIKYTGKKYVGNSEDRVLNQRLMRNIWFKMRVQNIIQT